MTSSLNSGALNNILEESMNYMPSMETIKIFYLRNLTRSNAYFYDNNDLSKKWSWFYSHDTIQAKVLKPPQPIIYPNTTTSIIVYFSQRALKPPQNSLTIDTLKWITKIKFMTGGGICELDFMVRGHRRVVFNGTPLILQNNINCATFCKLNSSVNMRTIWGVKTCIIEISEDGTQNPDINL